MMAGSFERWDTEKQLFPHIFSNMYDFLCTHNVLELERTSHFIDGKVFFANVAEEYTKMRDTTKLEVHNTYADVHVVLSGMERQVFSLSSAKGTPLEDRLLSDDVAFYAIGKEDPFIDLCKNQFTVFFPHELHAPLCAISSPEKVCKVIFKIHKSVFGL